MDAPSEEWTKSGPRNLSRRDSGRDETGAARPAARYAPQYGGYCAYGVAGNYKVKIDPEAWRTEDGKLYLNYDLAVQRRWYSDIPGFIARATRNWPACATDPARTECAHGARQTSRRISASAWPLV
ncbi:MAG: hypothetical protein H0W15_01870 [Gemmatimonadales bacterium]|nr:hypothetical protein [Gemmatimonadales bacterium]